MWYYRLKDEHGNSHVLVKTSKEGKLNNLTLLNTEVKDFRDLLKASFISGLSIDQIANGILSGNDNGQVFELEDLIENSRKPGCYPRLIAPVEPDEMWAAGPGNFVFTPEAIAQLPEQVQSLYNSARPPMIYKGSSQRVVGPFDDVGIRGDIPTTSAEGEVVLVLFRGNLVGFSTGNEVAGGLLGESMWWSAASKVFKHCASLGPCIATTESIEAPNSMKLTCSVNRNGKIISENDAETLFRRTPSELAKWTSDHDDPPEVSILYTGGLVGGGPLESGDIVTIGLDHIGFVENKVIEV